ncbi:NACHT domain-containing protein [Hymenobacter siberiensis]|jgi:predicted NACHT family NTPase|uniref:NACHT domain-containing protein n=1 Tax=Hymenobacter siberiensis TaxID=2848396 RepID=UPI001C1E786F|nr:NACHT domain-containing protein [Hymenobacter siberiensis]
MEHSGLEIAKDVVTTAKPLTDLILPALLAPRIKSVIDFLKKKGIEKSSSSEAVEKSFRNYLNDAYGHFCVMNTLVFPNQQILIKDIYQPLTLRTSYGYEIKEINVFEMRHLEKYGRILIADTAGMGKSTLVKWIGASIIEQNTSIPVLIELKKLSNKHKIIHEICTQLGDVFSDFDKDIILHLIKQGEFTFLLDGFDEVKYEHRAEVIEDIKGFIHKSSKNWFILTSRKDSALTAFGDFQRFSITPLTLNESFQLIRKYDSVNNVKIGEQLIRDIKGKLEQVQEFLVNPFLVSLLYKTYTYNRDIPSKKTTFYEEIYTALYKHHDLTKVVERNLESGLDIQDFRTVTNQLGFDTAKSGELEYSEQELIKLLECIIPKCAGIAFKSSRFIEDIVLHVPLFNREGLVRWAHKSLQDFFAASYISSSPKKEQIITAICKIQKSSYLNIIDFLYEMEYKIIRNIILYDIAKSFIAFCESSYKGFDIPMDIIRKRQAIAFDTSHLFTYKSGFDISDEEEVELKKYTSIERNLEVYEYEYRKKNLRTSSTHYSTSSFRHEIMNTFFKKGCSILKPIESFPHSQHSIDRFVTSLAWDNIYILDDKKENFLNQIKWFDQFSDMLISHRVHAINDKALLDFNECINLVKVVEEGKMLDSLEDELNGL